MELAPTGACWVSVDGRRASRCSRDLMNAGDKQVVTAEKQIALSVGDAGAFAYTLNGRAGKSLGAAGKIVRTRITLANLHGVPNTLMDLGLRSPLLDFFKRGEVASDVRLLAASGHACAASARADWPAGAAHRGR